MKKSIADNDVLLIAGVRTPFGSFGGSLKDQNLTDLLQLVISECISRAGVEPDQIQDVVVGNVIQSATNAAYFARHAALKSGIPVPVPAKIVNRLCGSGMESMVEIARSIRAGEIDLGIAAGAEHMSQAPYILRGQRWGNKMGNSEIEDALTSSLTDQYTGQIMGITAENLATQYQISRAEQDEFASRSQELAENASSSGRLDKEIVPVPIVSKKGTELFSKDEYIKGASIKPKLAGLKPVFKADGSVTAGNASGINDGTVAFVMASGRKAKELGLPVLARVISWASVGVEPSIMGIGPAYAIPAALSRSELKLNDMSLIEVNEAFAAQAIAVERELKLDRNRVNVNGGAIAIGHPLGASGGRVALTLALEMQIRDVAFGVASLCIGGGQGIAMVLENIG